MRKADLVNAIASNTGINKVDILLVLENAFREIKKNIGEGKMISIRGFGTFMTKTRAAKKARIISKNIEIHLPEKKIPYFKPSKEFKKVLLEKPEKFIGNSRLV